MQTGPWNTNSRRGNDLDETGNRGTSSTGDQKTRAVSTNEINQRGLSQGLSPFVFPFSINPLFLILFSPFFSLSISLYIYIYVSFFLFNAPFLPSLMIWVNQVEFLTNNVSGSWKLNLVKLTKCFWTLWRESSKSGSTKQVTETTGWSQNVLKGPQTRKLLLKLSSKCFWGTSRLRGLSRPKFNYFNIPKFGGNLRPKPTGTMENR